MWKSLSIKNKIFFSFLYIILSVWLLMPLVKLYNLFKDFNSNSTPPNTSEIYELFTNPLKCIALLNDKLYLSEWGFLLVCLTLLIVVLYMVSQDTTYQQNGVSIEGDDNTHGSSKWANPEDYNKVVDVGTNDGLILGMKENKLITLPMNTFFNKNVAVFGSSGSRKTRGFIMPNIMHLSNLGQSMIITDPKGENCCNSIKYLIKKGYTVKVLNLVNMLHSDRWNPVTSVTDDISAQTFTEIVIENTKIPGSKSDYFWESSEKNLLKALTLYIVENNSEEEKNVAAIYKMLSQSDSTKLKAQFEALKNDDPARMCYNVFAQSSDNTKGGVITGLANRLQVFQNQVVQNMTSTSDIDLELPIKEKCAYFCITSDMESTFDFIAGLFFSFLFIKLTKYADEHGGKGNREVFFLLDEFPNIGQIKDFTKKISTMRSRGLNSCIVFQNIAQLENRYPLKEWTTIMGNCDTKLFLGCNDSETAEYVSDYIGKATVTSKSKRKQAGFEGLMDFGSITTTTTERPLIEPSEVLQFDINKGIIMLKGQKPIVFDKMDYEKYKDYKMLKPINIKEYKPFWARPFYKMEGKTLEEIKHIKEEEIKGDIKESNPFTQKNDATKNYNESDKNLSDDTTLKTKNISNNENDTKKELVKEPKQDEIDNKNQHVNKNNGKNFW